MRISRLSLALACSLLPLSQAASAAEAPNVVVSIKPVHSLVAGVMKGAGQPQLIVKAGGSPHTYSLKPSEAAALQEAQMVVWVGDELEIFLEGPIETLATDARVLSLAEAPGVNLLAFREGGPWAEHEDHDDHGDHDHHEEHAEHEDHAKHEHHAEHDGHGKHDDHAHDHAHGEHADHDDHAHHEEHAEHKGHDDHDHHEGHAEHASHDDHDHDEHAHDKHDAHAGHHHGEEDMHIWLDPENAKAMVGAVAEALIELDPEHAGIYRTNQKLMVQQLDGLSADITAELAAVKDAPFIVFHDAYQYMEQRFGLSPVGSITVSPERQPGAARLQEIREKITELGARCVFAEPQFEPRLVGVVVEGTGAKTGVLDPLGASLQDGPELYFEMMRGNAAALRNCLAESS